MIGIVIVSHSQQLAAGVQELARQMVQTPVPVAVAGGLDDPDHPIGTDVSKVYEAILSVYHEDGVLVLMDLGSAVLSAETALELLLPEQRARVALCAAPLVEGTLAAVVQASVGGTLAQVLDEANGALAAKVEHLQGTPFAVMQMDQAVTQAEASVVHMLTLTVRNRLGLHARPAARFVATANRFTADIRVQKGEKTANAKSINQVATLGARQGETLVLTFTGLDAVVARESLQALAERNFDEQEVDLAALLPETAVLPAWPTVKGELTGIPASPGIAIAPVALYRPQLPPIITRPVEDTAAEWLRLEEAIAAAQMEINTIYQQSLAQIGASEAAIFEAHLLILQDPALLQSVHADLLAQQVNAEAVWFAAMNALADTYRQLDDVYMQARAADVLDVGHRVLEQLLAVERPSLDFPQPVILVVSDLTPSDTARLRPEMVLGLCTELGGATAHSAILARALGIPAVVGMGRVLSALTEGQLVAIDGRAGRMWVDPDYDTLADLQAQQQVWLGEQLRAKALGQAVAATRDGHKVEVAANIGGPNDTRIALEYGAEGVGLFRTEFLFLSRETAPTEEEQFLAYRQVAEAMGKRSLVIRILDIGGDKPLPYLPTESESNPFLGWRGIRFCLDQPDIFKAQLRAILRASVDDAGTPYHLRLMFPMVGTVAELRTAKAMLAEVQAEFRLAQLPFDAAMQVGIMIEVPSAVAVADQLAAEADFFSIGTNDLTQYVMAADRGNARVANLATAMQPAVLRLVQQTVQAGHAAGIWVGMCGELAGNALVTPVLVGLGLDELSMSAPAIPAVKEAIRRLSLPNAQRVAAEVLRFDSATAVADYLRQLEL